MRLVPAQSDGPVARAFPGRDESIVIELGILGRFRLCVHGTSDSEEAMGRRPYSDDLRSRVVAAVAEGCSRRAAGKRFAVSPSSSIRWVELHEETGSVSPRRCAGKSRSPLEQARTG